ncbi:MAG: SDR family NAD(P)-dependent oxidoreductase [Planctomycetes bacterium]|nr:SDR family NAD(P)-dependent oxidoreductase [Planctomycetota bacterium]
MTLQHQTALISGGGGGVGKAIARALVDLGIRVALMGRDQERLARTKAELAVADDLVLLAPCDVTDRAQLSTAVDAVLTQLGSLDILVCGAGINVQKRSLRSIDPADWDKIIATNLTGAFNLVHAVLPHMRERGQGLVIQLGSLSGMRVNTLSGVGYSVSKFGQAALGISIGREERGRSIRSTVLYAGEINTPLLDARGARPGGGEDTRRQNILQPEDVGAAVRFLAELPPRVHIPELVIKPTIDDFF